MVVVVVVTPYCRVISEPYGCIEFPIGRNTAYSSVSCTNVEYSTPRQPYAYVTSRLLGWPAGDVTGLETGRALLYQPGWTPEACKTRMDVCHSHPMSWSWLWF